MNKLFISLGYLVIINSQICAEGPGYSMEPDHSVPTQLFPYNQDCYSPDQVEKQESPNSTTYTVKKNAKKTYPISVNSSREGEYHEYPQNSICFSKGELRRIDIKRSSSLPKPKLNSFSQIENFSTSQKSLIESLSSIATKATSVADFQDKFCNKGNLVTTTVRSKEGILCNLKSIASLALLTCQGKRDFNQSGCMNNAVRILSGLIPDEVISFTLTYSNPAKNLICSNLTKFPQNVVSLSQEKCK